jgi:hypothetical protein
MRPCGPPHAGSHDRGIVVDHHGLGNPAQAHEAPDHPLEEVGHPPGEAEYRGVGRRVRERHHPPVGLPVPAGPHRDAHRQLPPVPVGELPRQVGRPLVAAGLQEQRTDLRQVLLQDRDPARVALPAQALQDHRGRRLGIVLQHPRHRVLVGIQLGAHRSPAVPGRLGELQEPDHGRPPHPEPSRDRRLAQALPVVEPLDLCPVMHVVHPFLLPSRIDGSIGREPHQVLEVSSFRPARGVKFSGGVDILRPSWDGWNRP